jgi:hypothetical protein
MCLSVLEPAFGIQNEENFLRCFWCPYLFSLREGVSVVYHMISSERMWR